MANMGKTTKRQVAVRLYLSLCRAVEKKFRRDGDTSGVVAYIRALEASTRDVALTASDYKLIATAIDANERKRRNRTDFH